MNPLSNLNNLINIFAFYDESHFLSIFYFQFFMMVFFFYIYIWKYFSFV